MSRIQHPRTARACTIIINGKSFRVWPLLRKGQYPYLYYDHNGMLYEVSWVHTDKGFTPHQRAHAHYTHADIVYIRHEHGLVAYQRKLKHAMRTSMTRMLQLEELEAMAHEVNGTFMILNRANPQPQLEYINELVDYIIISLDQARNDALKEAREHFSYVVMFVDSRGRFNIGVLMCHTATAYERLRERLENIQLWHNVFAQRLLATEQLIDEFFRAVSKLKKRIETHLNELQQGKVSWKLLISQLRHYTLYFERWQYIKPFDGWSRHTISDLRELKRVALLCDEARTLALLTKLLHAAALKLISKELFISILLLSSAEHDMGIHKIYRTPIADEVRRHLIVASKQLKQISDTGFRFRVRNKVLTNLRILIHQLDKPFDKAHNPRELLKQTAALL